MVNKEKMERNVYMELLRIVAMLMIIVGHAIVHSQLLECISEETINYYLVSLIRVVCQVATNIYVLISGYFLCKSRFKIEKLLLIWGQTFFYSSFIYFLGSILGEIPFSIQEVTRALLPVSGNQYWFARVYLGLYVLFPFVNIFLHHMNKRQYQIFLGICIILFSLWHSFIPFATTLNDEGGNSIIWFLVLYCFAAYIRIYGLPKKIDNEKVLSILIVGFLLLAFISEIVLSKISHYIGFGGKGSSLLSTYTAFPIFFSSVSIVVAFVKNNKKPNDFFSKLIVWFSSSTFGVYLIHDNKYIRNILWEKINISAYANQAVIVPLILISSVCVFVFSVLLDKMTFQRVKKFFKSKKISEFANRIEIFWNEDI